MAIIKENKILFGTDNNIYQLRKNNACGGCYFRKHSMYCENTLERLFGNKYKFNANCARFIGRNGDTKLSFVKIGDGI